MCMEKKELKKLMDAAYLAHLAYAKKWSTLKYQSIEKGLSNSEANTVAYDNTKIENKLRYEKLLVVLKDVTSNYEKKDWDKVLEFITYDSPSLRIGYKKEYLIKKLKKVELTKQDQEKIKSYIIELLSLNGYRRELSYFAKLVFKWYEEEDINKIIILREETNSKNTKRKIDIYLESIFAYREGRPTKTLLKLEEI
jgi:hypothetical protein